MSLFRNRRDAPIVPEFCPDVLLQAVQAAGTDAVTMREEGQAFPESGYLITGQVHPDESRALVSVYHFDQADVWAGKPLQDRGSNVTTVRLRLGDRATKLSLALQWGADSGKWPVQLGPLPAVSVYSYETILGGGAKLFHCPWVERLGVGANVGVQRQSSFDPTIDSGLRFNRLTTDPTRIAVLLGSLAGSLSLGEKGKTKLVKRLWPKVAELGTLTPATA